MIKSFENKTVIITGASAGVGAACARLFASHKAKLVLVARGEAALNTIAEELRSQCEVLTVVMNVANNDDCLALLEKAEAAFGAVHVIINNAGMHARGDLKTVSPADVAAMVDINMRAPLLLSCAAIPYLQRAGEGAIVNVGSLAGRAPLQGAATYSATKAGLRAFSYALADELRDSGISVGSVSPGPIDTGFIMDEIDAVEDIVFSQPMSSAEQVAAGILTVASGEEVEVVLPAASAKLTHISYLFPNLRRRLRPKLYEQGRKNKEKYRNRQAAK
ncbi:oxidoreductase, short-chain dehydrogenase/reductase family protein [marine gamma proteobacterium HTCC2207]|jgi:short-subunit dehydrogenase|uniref:Oxidoreductase, short-chain dehydrogenase/reductase family protein n=1 Tax=gamma proteobacterium HTCC2207 TaxID=314287 RepID=Q1YPN1_9GAMM|nr:oxidoreductase, short-chain dehydrogenase/reductase family protein [marine gamma proteobacterium HTCC2207] [gamma proteobacterium HTCC2207]MBT6592560.1 SDR family NAD(P)-dependent oxidoreductase [Porticoccaceae bacterium]MDC3261414.1 SDR family NAD(P)-dependent oxidoreductase [bacterium]MDC0589165.1 SDR family NAD(P)-dependent oxidoreductase [Porticoccaceae bacterium]MDG1079149.1 SDR family NAD(P)-dependent oxidoreductase [Porticoccaceae bacterium]